MRELDYGDAAGLPELRAAIAAYLVRARAVVCRPEQVVIVRGSQQGIDLVARVLLDPGDRVLLEEPHYSGARTVLAAAGARLLPVLVDAEGMDLERVHGAAAAARLAFVTPSHQFPTVRRTRARNRARRAALVDTAREYLGKRVEIAGANAGLHVLLWVRGVPARRTDALIRRAARVGVGVYSPAAFYLGEPPGAGLVLGYDSLEEDAIREGMRRLARALA